MFRVRPLISGLYGPMGYTLNDICVKRHELPIAVSVWYALLRINPRGKQVFDEIGSLALKCNSLTTLSVNTVQIEGESKSRSCLVTEFDETQTQSVL